MAAPAQVAVLGAGMAGAILARRLSEAGLAVTVLDKGRQPGGRMANRHDDAGHSFDHGAQVMRPHGPAFSAQLATWQARGVAAPWGEAGAFIGVPDMTAPVRDLLAGLEIRQGRTVTGLLQDARGWRLAWDGVPEETPFRAVALTCPAPQAVRLLAEAGHALDGLERVTYAPCWSLMLAGETDLPFAEPVLRWESGAIAAVFREGTKPGRGRGAGLVVHASAAWSRAHLDEPRETVREALLRAFEELVGMPVRPVEARVHRWRYAAVETALGHPYLYDPDLGLGYAGDGCLGPRIEAAYDSGLALAERMISDLR